MFQTNAVQQLLQKRGPVNVELNIMIRLPGGSQRQAHYQELFEQETVVRTHVEAIVRDVCIKNVLGGESVQKVWIGFKNGAENVAWAQN